MNGNSVKIKSFQTRTHLKILFGAFSAPFDFILRCLSHTDTLWICPSKGVLAKVKILEKSLKHNFEMGSNNSVLKRYVSASRCLAD